MGRFLLLVAAVTLVGCNRSAPSTGAPTSATSGTVAAVDPGAETEEERKAVRDLLDEAARNTEAEHKVAEREFRLMSSERQKPIDELRAVLLIRPPKELTPTQREILNTPGRLFKLDQVMSYRLAVADQHGGLSLSRSLRLDAKNGAYFRMKYGWETEATRGPVTAALKTAIANGVRSLTDDQKNTLRGYSTFLDKLPD